jgi:hypothetical protein
MLFSELAQYFQQLEATSSRTELIRILADLFRECAPDEIAPTTYLIQGRLAPAFVPLEMGMGTQSVASAMAQAYGVGRESVLARFEDTTIIHRALAHLPRVSGLGVRWRVNPEQQARRKLKDGGVRLAGPASQRHEHHGGPGVAIGESSPKGGDTAGYLLYADGRAIGMVAD